MIFLYGFPGGASGKKKKSACQGRRHKRCRFNPWVGKIPLEKEMATHSGILTREIPWTEEPGGVWSVGPQRLSSTARGSQTPSCIYFMITLYSTPE